MGFSSQQLSSYRLVFFFTYLSHCPFFLLCSDSCFLITPSLSSFPPPPPHHFSLGLGSLLLWLSSYYFAFLFPSAPYPVKFFRCIPHHRSRSRPGFPSLPQGTISLSASSSLLCFVYFFFLSTPLPSRLFCPIPCAIPTFFVHTPDLLFSPPPIRFAHASSPEPLMLCPF